MGCCLMVSPLEVEAYAAEKNATAQCGRDAGEYCKQRALIVAGCPVRLVCSLSSAGADEVIYRRSIGCEQGGAWPR